MGIGHVVAERERNIIKVIVITNCRYIAPKLADLGAGCVIVAGLVVGRSGTLDDGIGTAAAPAMMLSAISASISWSEGIIIGGLLVTEGAVVAPGGELLRSTPAAVITGAVVKGLTVGGGAIGA